MLWRSSILFPLLAALALSGMWASHTFPSLYGSALLWPVSAGLALVALGGFVGREVHWRRRLQDLGWFIDEARDRDPSSFSLTWEGDEIGALGRKLQQFLFHQHAQLRSLQGERKKLEAILQSMADGVMVVDRDGYITLCSRRLMEILGLDPKANWVGRPFLACFRHPLLQRLVQEVAGRQPGDPPLTREVELEGRQHRHHLSVSAVRISADGAADGGYVLVFHDLTQVRRLEAMRADFVANVSHELRTPLTAIKGYTETLLGGAWRDSETALKFLATIDRHAERLGRLIEDLLTLSDLELGKAPLRREEVFLEDLLEEVLETLQDKASRGGVILGRDLPENLPALWGDEDRIHQVLLNLVDNAVKYTPEGGQVRVRVREVPLLEFASEGGVWLLEKGSDYQGPWLEVAVCDTGCGIPQKDLPRLTQRFYRVDKARSRELGGTGLGLAIVKHIVQAHGGLLNIESQVNKGTTVRVFFPLASKG